MLLYTCNKVTDKKTKKKSEDKLMRIETDYTYICVEIAHNTAFVGIWSKDFEHCFYTNKFEVNENITVYDVLDMCYISMRKLTTHIDTLYSLLSLDTDCPDLKEIAKQSEFNSIIVDKIYSLFI